MPGIGVVDSVLWAPVIEYRGQKIREPFRGRGKGRKTEGGEFVCDLLIPGRLIRGRSGTIVEREQRDDFETRFTKVDERLNEILATTTIVKITNQKKNRLLRLIDQSLRVLERGANIGSTAEVETK